MEILQSTQNELSGLMDEVDAAKSWVAEKTHYIQNLPPVGFETKVSDERVQALKVRFLTF